MADTTEKVEYIFEGDVSALRKSTTDAISLLKQYGAAIQKTAASTDFKASKTSLSSFTSAVGATITQVNTLVKALNKLGPEAMGTLAPQISNIQDATSTLKDSLEFLDSGLVTTSKDFNELAGYVRESKATFEAAASKAYGMATSFKDLGTLSDTAGAQVKTSMQGASEATNTFADRTAQNIQSYRSTIEKMQALNFASEISAQYDTITKSARESAQAFASMSRQESLSATYGPALGKLIDLSDQGRVKLALLGATMRDQWNSITSVFDPIVSKVQAFKDKASESFQGIAAHASTVAQAFRRIVQGETDADSSANRAAQGHRTLGDSLKSLVSKFKTETEAIDTEDQKLKNKNNTLNKSSKLHNTLSGSVRRLGNFLKREISMLAGSIKIADVVAKSAKQAINYIENLNLFTVAMGDSVEQGKEFVKGMQEIYGMDPSNLYRYTGYFYQLTDAIGMTDKASATMSLSMTKASNDIASLFNVPIEEVVNNLASGMQGMSRAVRKYGMDIRAVTLQQTAANYGITTQVETMSEADRMALRYITMMNQVSNALKQTTDSTDDASKEMGDFARNIETPANQLRIFKEQITQLGRAIGNFLVAPLSKVLPYINGFIMALREAINIVGGLLGVLQETDTTVSTSGATSEIEAIGTAADEAAQKVKNLTAPFDELNVLSESASSGDSILGETLDPKLAEAISNMQLNLDNIRMKANDIRDSLLEAWGLGSNKDSFDVESLKNKLQTIKDLVVSIGIGIAAWKVTSGTLTAIKTLNTLLKSPSYAITIGVTLAIVGITLSSKGLKSAVEKQLNKTNFGEIVAGGLLTTGGSTLLGSKIAAWIATTFKGSAIASALSTAASNLGLGTAGAVGAALGAGISGVIFGLPAYFVGIWDAIQRGLNWLNGLLIPAGSTAATAGIGAIIGACGGPLTAGIGALIGLAVGLVTDGIILVIQHWDDITVFLKNFFTVTIPTMWENFKKEVKNIPEEIRTWWDKVLKPIKDFDWKSFGYTIGKKTGEAVSIICNSFKTFFTITLPEVWDIIKDSFKTFFTKTLPEFFLEKIPALYNTIKNSFRTFFTITLPEAFSDIGDWFIDVGKAIWDGIKKGWDISVQSVGNLATGFLQGFKDALGIHSPSKEFKKVGEYTSEGFYKGFGDLTSLSTQIQKQLIDIKYYVQTFSNETLTVVTNTLLSIAKMFKAMSVASISYIAEIISALDSIPRNITTVHTIVTKELSESSVAKIKSGTKMPMMAGGGVVTSPTIAMIGEGKYSEAVIPLDDSPQMNQLVERIADALDDPDRNPKNAPVNVRVFIGDTEWDAFTYKSAERGKKSVGVQPITTGG